MPNAQAQVPVEEADGSLLDVAFLQVHVIAASVWLVLAVLVALVAVPALRRIPSAFGLHVLQVRRSHLVGALWIAFGATLASGTYLLLSHAIYDQPVSGSDWSDLEAKSYGVPYYYALYAKIAIFFAMGVATALLAREAQRAAVESEAAGGPVDLDLEADEDDEWIVEPGDDLDFELAGAEGGTALATRARRRAEAAGLPVAGLWGAVVVLAVGLGAIGLCVTLIKYFNELSKAAVVYEQLRGRG
ncbi:MAG: hypothetical protein ACT4QG_06485 [Sporichthyaceae bacterium]